MNWGLTGGIIGGVIGVAGGLLGTYFSIKNTNGPRERAFVIKSALLCWILVIVFLLGLYLIPLPYNQLLWIPYALLLGFGINRWNRAQNAIREEERRHQQNTPPST